MTTVRLLLVVIGVLTMAGCGMASSIVFLRLVAEVNGRLAPSQGFSELFWTPNKYFAVWRQHAQLFPGSDLRRKAVVLAAGGSAGLVIATVGIAIL